MIRSSQRQLTREEEEVEEKVFNNYRCITSVNLVQYLDPISVSQELSNFLCFNISRYGLRGRIFYSVFKSRRTILLLRNLRS